MPDETDTSDNKQVAKTADTFMEALVTGRARRELLIVKRGARTFGVFADEADGIVEWRAPSTLPHAPQAVLGVVSVRGRMLTLLDPLAVLDQQIEAETSTPGFIIALRGDEQLALAVDQAVGVVEIVVDEIEASERGAGANIWHGIVRREPEPIQVLNITELFAAAMQGTERRRRRF